LTLNLREKVGKVVFKNESLALEKPNRHRRKRTIGGDRQEIQGRTQTGDWLRTWI
jgi:hypothetical protein